MFRRLHGIQRIRRAFPLPRFSPEWTLAVKNLLLPMYCRACGTRLLTEANGFFCPDCWESSVRIERPFCSLCGKPHQRMIGLGALSNYPCKECRERPNRHVQRIWGAAQYDGAVGAAIRLYKFKSKSRLAQPLAELMIAFAEVEMDFSQYDCITPVPLYPTRLRERGFNQSLLLARALSDAFGVETGQSLARIRPTRAQSRLKTEERAMNVRGAFAVTDDALKGKRVLLIDDVITTGGTITECARAMKRAGAKSVEAFAAALAYPGVRY